MSHIWLLICCFPYLCSSEVDSLVRPFATINRALVFSIELHFEWMIWWWLKKVFYITSLFLLNFLSFLSIFFPPSFTFYLFIMHKLYCRSPHLLCYCGIHTQNSLLKVSNLNILFSFPLGQWPATVQSPAFVHKTRSIAIRTYWSTSLPEGQQPTKLYFVSTNDFSMVMVHCKMSKLNTDFIGNQSEFELSKCMCAVQFAQIYFSDPFCNLDLKWMVLQ